jgi:DNA-binding NtrC family response regulator
MSGGRGTGQQLGKSSGGNVMEEFSELSFIGRSPAFAAATRLLKRFAACDATLLLQVETGTGKELAARAVHYLSDRHGHPFIPLNCGALPDTLVENELFGHARGAFTDARDARRGLVASAEGGTLFLDEVEALSPKAQVVLLRFLQDGTYRPLGGQAAIKGNVRVITATNLDLAALSRSGRFRQDLLYRLAILTVQLPPLRQRPGDVLVLARHFLGRFARQYGRPEPGIEPASARLLGAHGWPGNVRELENLMHRLFLLCEGPELAVRPADLDPASWGAEEARELTVDLSFAQAKARAIAQFESDYLRKALDDAEGNVSLAARRAGKERRSFGKLLKKHRIDRSQFIAD